MIDILKDRLSHITPVYKGYAITGAKPPYIVVRPLTLDPSEEAVSGTPLVWGEALSLYCCADSVDASYNLAIEALREIYKEPFKSYVPSARLGYVGGQVEGHYETQITVDFTKGTL